MSFAGKFLLPLNHFARDKTNFFLQIKSNHNWSVFVVASRNELSE